MCAVAYLSKCIWARKSVGSSLQNILAASRQIILGYLLGGFASHRKLLEEDEKTGALIHFRKLE